MMKKVCLYLLFVMMPVMVGPLLAADKSHTSTDSLRRFFSEVNSYKARFKQVVLDDASNVIQESSGSFWIERPNKFRWDYNAPFYQQIISDGKRIWVYDKELQQVTVRPLTNGLASTPAMLLAGKGRLDDNFTVKVLDKADKLEWYELTPKRNDNGFEKIRVGFDNGNMSVLEMVDGLQQTTRITMLSTKENAVIDDAKFSFTPPEGVDVVSE